MAGAFVRARRPSAAPPGAEPQCIARVCARSTSALWGSTAPSHVERIYPPPSVGQPARRLHGRAHCWRRFCGLEAPPRPSATAPPRPQPCSHRMDFTCTGGGRIQHSASAGKHQESGLAQADQRIMGTESAEHARRRGGGAGMRTAKLSSARLMKRGVESPKSGAEE